MEIMLTTDCIAYTSWIYGEWWLSGSLGALRPEGHRFESHSSRHVETLGKSFTCNCLLHFGMLTSTQHQCCSQERL